MFKSKMKLYLIFTTVLGLSPSISHATEYFIRPFNFTLGGAYSTITDINAGGDLVGHSNIENQSTHGFTFASGSMVDLGTLGGRSSYGLSINDNGVIAGYSQTTSTTRGFIYENGIMTDIGSLGQNLSFARAINNSNQVVGSSVTSTNYSHAFLYENEVMVDLGTLGGGVSAAFDINNHGTVVGDSTTDGTNINYHAYMYRNGYMRDLGTLEGENSSSALAVNDLGVVIGVSGNRSFIYENGLMTELTGDGLFYSDIFVSDINNDNIIVGSSRSEYGGLSGWVWEDGVFTNLNSIAPEGWDIINASAINDRGQIVGYGYYEGIHTSYIMSPVPIPAAILLFISGLLPLIYKMKIGGHQGQRASGSGLEL